MRAVRRACCPIGTSSNAALPTVTTHEPSPSDGCCAAQQPVIDPDRAVDAAVLAMIVRQPLAELPVVENGVLVGMVSVADAAVPLLDDETAESDLDGFWPSDLVVTPGRALTVRRPSARRMRLTSASVTSSSVAGFHRGCRSLSMIRARIPSCRSGCRRNRLPTRKS